jgi:hypothetical protein
MGALPAAATDAQREEHERRQAGMENFLTRVYDEFRNLGVTPQDRALNYAATNVFNANRALEDATRSAMELESVEVALSPICRPGQQCYDVKLYFFYPQRQVQTVRKVYRFTIDVSDVVPVPVGDIKTYSVR